MPRNTVKLRHLLESQLPSYIKDEFPLINEFFQQYYNGLDFQGGAVDLINNIDSYLEPDDNARTIPVTYLANDINDSQDFIDVYSTEGFPDQLGVVQIDDEIIVYELKVGNRLLFCQRGFSGVSSFETPSDSEELVFKKTEASGHEFETEVRNLSILFLREFLARVKSQLLPGLQTQSLNPDLNQSTFIKQSRDFYSTRGTESAFKILFKALYNDEIELIRPQDNLISPSDAEFQLTRDLIVESQEGNPENLINATLFQDETGSIGKAYAPISHVEKISVGVLTDAYYKVSIDSSFNKYDGSAGLLYGNFSVHAKTTSIDSVSIGQTYIDVDSTVGFEDSGSLIVKFEDGTSGIITYIGKTNTQFVGILPNNVTRLIPDKTIIDQNAFAYGYDPESQDDQGIKIKIRSVLRDIQKPTNAYYQSEDTNIKIKSLGKVASDLKSNNWFFNTAQYYDVESLSLEDANNDIYKLTTKDDHIFRIGDLVELTDLSNLKTPNDLIVTDVYSSKQLLIRGSGITDVTRIVKASKRIRKFDSDLYSNVSIFNANVNNVYVDDDKVLVSSNSLPSFIDTKINPKSQRFFISGTYFLNDETIQVTTGIDHNFFTGDLIYYTPEIVVNDILLPNGDTLRSTQINSILFPQGTYVVKRIDENNIKLAKSTSNLYAGKFEKIVPAGGANSTFITNNIIERADTKGKELEPQLIYREIAPPVKQPTVSENNSRYSGILINGVEVLNYKTTDFVYHGKLNFVDVTSGGSDYDIINPPIVHIEDTVGSGATGICAVSGGLKEIRIVDPGFDYLEVPKIKITGGNGIGARAEANMIPVHTANSFDATGISTIATGIGEVGIGTTVSTIGFTTHHKFKNGERVVYKTFGEKAIGGLSTDATYYAGVLSPYKIKLHNNLSDAVAGVGTITLSDFGEGTHELRCLNAKSAVGSISIVDPGRGYQNKQRTVAPAGINTALDIVNIFRHGYKTGEIVNYTVQGSAIGGLTSGSDYYVTVVDNDSFKLSSIGIGSTSKDFYFNTNQYQKLSSIGVGTHSFNYPAISVELIGKVGLASTGGRDFKAVIQPIFRGEATSIQLTNTGVGYGVSDVINFKRDPRVTLRSGNSSQLEAVINANGQIADVIINRPGQEYNSPPELIVKGVGQGAKLTPTLFNGAITGVKIISSGVGYASSTTTIEVLPAGSGAQFVSDIQSWTINKVRKNLNNIVSDDAFISESNTGTDQLQLSYAYAPRSLRKIVYSVDTDGSTLYGKKDLQIINGEEITNSDHSGIIGWAYDGHPIYGPYGYENATGGNIVQMRSGYVIDLKDQRPPTSVFPQEFFLEDFTWVQSTNDFTLDRNNGRFCVTPDYPNGTYAYFATFDTTAASDGVFKGFKKPAFPYLIGDSFNSKPNKFNFDINSNERVYDIRNHNWRRNSYPYAMDKKNSGYDYLQKPFDFVNSDSNIETIEKGFIDFVGIFTGGSNYQVNDRIVFDKEKDTEFFSASRVSKVGGKTITAISAATTSISNVELYPFRNGSFIGISSEPHNLKDGDVINLTGISTTSSKLAGNYQCGISTNLLSVTKFIGTVNSTGIVTFIDVSAKNLEYPQIQVNDILQIGTETVKVLDIDIRSSRLRVLRAQNGVVGVSHTITTLIKENPRRFTFNVGIKTTFSGRRNREYYFNPTESLGISTSTTTGAGSTVVFANPGAGSTSKFILAQHLYLPNHDLITGDEVLYQVNGGDPIGVQTEATAGVGVIADGQKVFVARLGSDFVGLSSVRVGLGTTGTFAGIADTTSHCGLMYFVGVGTGVNHSLQTNHKNVITGSIEKNEVTVSIAGTHGLLLNDNVFVEVDPILTNTQVVRYNSHNRNMTIGELSFTLAGISSDSALNITDHGLVTGQSVIHSATTPATGLLNNEKYYAYVVDKNNVKLCESIYQTKQPNPKFVDISNDSSGSLLPVNPPIKFYKDTSVRFDMSDSSLSYEQNTTLLPAFTFKFYTDSNYTHEYVTEGKSADFAVRQTGTIGAPNARIDLDITDNTPKLLYYRIEPLRVSGNLKVNLESVIDKDVKGYNEISVFESLYTGNHIVSGVTTNTFNYLLDTFPESVSYASSTSSSLTYTTNSLSAYGRIAEIDNSDRRKGYSKLPGISTIRSSMGSGAVLKPTSTQIGKVVRTNLKNIGFNYPSDPTLAPDAQLPQIFEVTTFFKFDRIGITSFGQGYTVPPALVVLDGTTKKRLTDLDIRYNLGDTNVSILKNSQTLSNSTPIILPLDNPNGIRVSNLVFDREDKTVTATMAEIYSDNFPLSIGDKVLVEHASVGIASTAKGFNSEDYDFETFEIIGVHENLGGNLGIVTYRFDKLSDTDTMGTLDTNNSSITLTPERYFPIFNFDLVSNNFQKGNTIVSGNSEGIVSQWDEVNQMLTIESADTFVVGDVIEETATGSKATITKHYDFDTEYNVDYYSLVDNGWRSSTGFLNKFDQKIADNDYYQNFSYSIKSKVPFDNWDDVVSSLLHTAGFKKFADLQLESTLTGAEEDALDIRPIDSTTIEIDMISVGDLECVNNFDFASENYLQGNNDFSDEITFKTRLITDYSESVSNRVLTIDDISGLFNSNRRTTPFEIVSRVPLNSGQASKFLCFVKDATFTKERQMSLVTVVNSRSNGQSMISQYGDVDTILDLGSYDYAIEGGEGVLQFFPNKFKLNRYALSIFSYNLDRLGLNTGSIGLNTSNIGQSTAAGFPGSLVSVASSNIIIAGIQTTNLITLGGIGTETSGTRAAKLLVSVENSNNHTEFEEISVIHDGTNVQLLEYNQLTNHTLDSQSGSTGLGTFGASLSGNDVLINYSPIAGVTTTHVNVVAVGLASESYTGFGTDFYSFAKLSAEGIDIASSATPTATTVGRYGTFADTDVDAAYGIVVVSDKTNNIHEMMEFTVVDDDTEVFLTEFGNVDTSGAGYPVGLGTLGATRLGSTTLIKFTPNPSIDVHVKTFINKMSTETINAAQFDIDLDCAELRSNFDTYTGTEITVRRDFPLTHKNDDIFTREFNATDTGIINLTENTILLPNHFFVTGQELVYASPSGIKTDSISIASTDGFVGVGTTTTLPRNVFCIKVGEDKIKLATSATNALKRNPVSVAFTGLAGASGHTLTAKDANSKVIVAVDNMIQSPLVATAVTTGLTTTFAPGKDIMFVSGITSFFAGDFVKLGTADDDEIVKIVSIGVGQTNAIKVRRSWFGTGLANHSENTLVTKVEGNYNIVQNTINFAEAPYGNRPIGSATDPPSFRDWTGITTSSTFFGRTFLRSGPPGSTVETYTKNHIYDDISGSFDGLTKEFVLTSEKQNVIGITTSTLILVNGIFQGLGENSNYTVSENAGITSISFTGTASSVAYDVNNANIPVGGVLLSVGSTTGGGYQPLVAAGGTAVIARTGIVTNVAIGNSGSGYRVGVQTTVNVSIKRQRTDGVDLTGIGTAQITNGHITGIAVTSNKIFYKPANIINVGYSSITGITTVSTSFPHNLSVGDNVVLSGLAFTCDYLPSVGVVTASYDHTSGILTVTTASAHGLAVSPGKNSDVILTGLAFTCGLGATVPHIYPRNTDVFYDTAISVGSTTATTITLDVGRSGAKDQYDHTFVGTAGTFAVIQGGDYLHTFQYALDNAVTTGVGTQFTPTGATYDPKTGNFVITIPNHGLDTNVVVGIATSSIVFRCDMDQQGSDHPYPRPTDPIAGINTAITATTANTITINVGTSKSVLYDVSAATYNPATGALVLTIGSHTLLPNRSIKLAKESLIFTCTKNGNTTQHRYPRAGDPYYAGSPVTNVGTSTIFTTNIGVTTVATQYVSGGTIQPAIIAPRANNNSPSGQDAAFGGTVVTEVVDATTFKVNTGISTRTHFYARGGKVDEALEVVIDDPLAYVDIPLVYASGSSGVGTGGKVDIVVGQGSSVIEFNVSNTGFGYRVGQTLSIGIGGTVGIPTNPSIPFKPFEVTVDRVDGDSFNAWSVGEFQVLDEFSSLFNGQRQVFPIKSEGEFLSIVAAKGSNISIQDNLLVFLNDIIQVPGESYEFLGGASIRFFEAPKSGDSVKFLLYKGTGEIDVRDVDVLETVKIGDTLQFVSGDPVQNQKKRAVSTIISASDVSTNVYPGPGLAKNESAERPITWCRQRDDVLINGKVIDKSRGLYEPNIFPTAYIIKSVGVGSTEVYVDNVRPGFNQLNESQLSVAFQKKVSVFDYSTPVGAAGTALVSVAGTVSSIILSTGGVGYSTTPDVTIESAVGLAHTLRATATASITAGVVTSITVSSPGTGYTFTDPPAVLIGPPAGPKTEDNTIISYSGDFGVITGINTTSVGVASTAIVFDLLIEANSPLRDNTGITPQTRTSGIATGDYFIVYESNVGSGVTALDESGNTIGVGNSFLDNIYRVADVSIANTSSIGIGTTNVARVTVSIAHYNGFTAAGLAISSFYGRYSWGKLVFSERTGFKSYDAITSNGVVGIKTGPYVIRQVPFKSIGFVT